MATKPTDYDSFRSFLKQVREEFELSQQYMADKFGLCGRSSYHDFETGKKRVTEEFIQSVADGVGMSPAEVLMLARLSDKFYGAL